MTINKRKRDWPQIVYKYWIKPIIKLPESIISEARALNDLWNNMVEGLPRFDPLPQDKKQRKEEQKKRKQFYREAQVKRRHLIKESSCYWANKETLLDRFETALRSKYRPRFHKFDPNKLCFVHRFTGGGIEAKRIFSSNSRRVSLEIHGHKRGTIKVMIAGVIIPFQIVFHRPFPNGAILKRLEILKRSIQKPVWSVCFTLEIPPERFVKPPTRGGEGALEVGYRKLNGSVRVGVLMDCDNTEEIFLPDSKKFSFVGSVKFLEELQSRLDKTPKDNLKMRSKLRKEINGHCGRLIRRRRHFYYNLANRLCADYSVLTLKKIELKKLAETARKENSYALRHSGHARKWACLSELVRILKTKATQFGIEIIEACQYTTVTCHQCMAEVSLPDEKRAEMVWTCPMCNSTWDQDHNAAENMLLVSEKSQIEGGLEQNKDLRKFITKKSLEELDIKEVL